MDIKTYISSGVIEDYAIGVLPAEEASILECVMSNNAEVKQAVFEAQETLEKLAMQQTMEPPAEIKEKILKQISFGVKDNEAQIIPLNNAGGKNQSPAGLSVWMKAASVAVIVGLGVLGYELNSKNTQLQQIAQNNSELNAKIANLENTNSLIMNSRRIELKGVEKHPNMIADVYWHTSKQVFLEVKNLPEAPVGKQYQLWAIVEGKPVDMGMYEKAKGTAIQEMKSVDNAQAFAITLEKEGGNVSPTMEEMYVMGTT